jgi:hypothetical protein
MDTVLVGVLVYLLLGLVLALVLQPLRNNKVYDNPVTLGLGLCMMMFGWFPFLLFLAYGLATKDRIESQKHFGD